MARRIDAVCLAFEDAWLRHAPRRIEDVLIASPDCDPSELIAALLAIELVYRRRAGETPGLPEYLDRFPDFAVEVEAVADMAQGFEHGERPIVSGTRLGRYHVLRELGRGAFGTVYLAEDEELRRPVAIKVAGDGQRASPDQVARLIEETRAAAKLRHPGIVGIYDVQPLGAGTFFAVQEYVEGCSLREALAQPRDHREMADLFARIADAIAYAHSAGFTHRDLVPDNILIDGEGQPRIADFGLALHIDDQARAVGERAGSWPYMAPEQVRGESHRLDGRADIWAVGVMIYEALTGRRPFVGSDIDGLTDDILHRAPRPPRQFARDLPAELERICMKCLAKAPEERIGSAGDLANALRHFATGRRTRIGRRALLAAAPVGLAGAFLAWHRSLDHGVAGDSPRGESLDLHVWKHRSWRTLAQPDSLPLRGDDQVRLTVHCHPARYAYLVWIDSRGAASPVFPWRRGDWTARLDETPVGELRLPSDALDAVWTMEVSKTGCELLMLLTRDSPWPLATHPKGLALFQDVPLPDALPGDEGLRIDFDQFDAIGAASRGPKSGTVRHLDDPLVRLHGELRRRLIGTFPRAQFLLFPVAT